MIIKNIKSKIIGIGKTVLMPDESLPISKEIAERDFLFTGCELEE